VWVLCDAGGVDGGKSSALVSFSRSLSEVSEGVVAGGSAEPDGRVDNTS
jgi:hypothetical protein